MTADAVEQGTSWTSWHGYAPLQAPARARLSAASGDVVEGLRRWRLWLYLGLDVIRNQYRRTVIGPWWLTLQTAIHIAGLGFLFSAVFDRPVREFLPYVGTAYIIFTLISGLTRMGSDLFVNEHTSIVSNRQPLSFLVFRGMAVELLQFAHNLVVIVAFGLLGMLSLAPRTLLIVPSVLIIAINGVAIALWLGPTVARFRDVGPVVGSTLQMLSFFTPIFWAVDSLRGQSRKAILAWNPFYYLLETFRGPLIGTPARFAFIGAAVITVVNLVLAVLVFSRTRSRIPYWVS